MQQTNEKNDLRARLKARRDAVSADRAREWNQKINATLAASAMLDRADLLLIYAPKGSELDLLPLVGVARKKGIPVAFPVCHTDTCTLEFRILEPSEKLVKGAYGIAIPPADAPLAVPTERSVCVLPGLSFAPDGARIGYGKGYYDRFLSTFSGVTVGALFGCMLSRSIPTEAHDRPVDLLITERGVIDCKKHRAPSGAGAVSLALQESEITKTADKKAVADAIKPLHLPPLLVLLTFLLLLISRPIDAALLDRSSETIGVILLQLLIFVLPAILYSRIKGERFASRIRIKMPRMEHLWFLFCMLAVMITGSLLACILTGGISSLTGSFTLYNTFTAQSDGGVMDTVAILLAYAVLPAFGEELIFRSYLCAEYEHLGVGVSIAVSTVLFAMLHFTLPLLLAYLFLGALLAAALYATRSFFAVLLLHTLYNVFCLFGQPYLSAFYLHAGSNDIFLFCLITLFLLFSAFAAGEARKIYHVYAIENQSSDYTTPTSLRALPKRLARALATPTAAVCLVVWLAVVIVDLVG